MSNGDSEKGGQTHFLLWGGGGIGVHASFRLLAKIKIFNSRAGLTRFIGRSHGPF